MKCKIVLTSRYKNAYVYKVTSFFKKDYYICWVPFKEFYTQSIPKAAIDLWREQDRTVFIFIPPEKDAFNEYGRQLFLNTNNISDIPVVFEAPKIKR